MQRWHGALPFAVILCACSREVERRAAHAGPLGTITVAVQAALAPPFRLDRTEIVLDGVPIREGVPVPSVDPLHVVEMAVDTSVPCGLLSSPRASIRVHAVRSMLSTGPTVVDFHVFDSGDPAKQPVSRLSGKWTLRGAQLGPGDDLRPYPARCAGLGALPRAECRVSAALDWARQERDVVLALCRDAKLKAMREAILRADAGDPDAAATLFGLEREAFECIGEDTAFVCQVSASDCLVSIRETLGCGVEPTEQPTTPALDVAH